MYASQFKIKIIDYFLKKHSTVKGIINEMPFYDSSRFIDLTFILGTSLYSIEIKSDKDSLIRLKDQVRDLLLISEYVSIALTGKYLTKAEEIIPTHVGIFLIDGNEVKMLRRAIKNSAIDSYATLTLLPKIELIKLAKKSNIEILPRDGIDSLRKRIAINLDSQKINKHVKIFLKQKHEKKFIVFNKEKSTPTSSEDLTILNNRFNDSIFSL